MLTLKYSPSSFWNTNNFRRERLERHRIKRTVLVQIFQEDLCFSPDSPQQCFSTVFLQKTNNLLLKSSCRIRVNNMLADVVTK